VLRLSQLAAISVAALTLGGCMSLREAPMATFDLSAPQSFSGRNTAGKGSLVVFEPTAIQTVDSNRMVARSGGQVSYVPAAQWSDRLPSLVQTRLVQAFENAGRIGSVGRAEDRISGDYQLITDIRAFEINVGAGAATVDIAAKIISNRNGGRVISGRVFHAQVPAGAVTGADASRALDQALGQVLTELVGWASGLV
jgi:cholesterol transport system auxiliary component